MGQSAYLLHRGDALDVYRSWPKPTAIISDGAYGVRGFHGDTVGTDRIAEWYQPHIEAWSRLAGPATTLWFWNTEVGWATVHPLLVRHGWEYVQAITWDKGIGHIAGNVNGKTIRRFPGIRLDPRQEPEFRGWEFRAPRSLHVQLSLPAPAESR